MKATRRIALLLPAVARCAVFLTGLVFAHAAETPAAPPSSEPARAIGGQLELFIDRHLIARMDGVELGLSQPVNMGLVLAFDAPWDGRFSGYVTVLKDGPTYRMNYRGKPTATVDIGGITIRPGDIIHANAEGVIRIPASCLEDLPAKAIQMRAFEHEVHYMLRRTDLPIGHKRQQLTVLLNKHGFAK